MTDLIYNHISVRLAGPEHRFLLNPFGLLYEEVTASNLVIVGLDGQLVTEGPWKVNPAGFVIHSAIHSAREDALCVLHTHTKAGCAVAAQEHGLLPLNQMSLEFHNRVAYHDYEGIALSNAEKKRLVADLGSKPVMILAQPRPAHRGQDPRPGVPAHVLPGARLRDPGRRPLRAARRSSPRRRRSASTPPASSRAARATTTTATTPRPTWPGTPCSGWSSACTRTTRTERDQRGPRGPSRPHLTGAGREHPAPFPRRLHPGVATSRRGGSRAGPGRCLRRGLRPRDAGRPRHRRAGDRAAHPGNGRARRRAALPCASPPPRRPAMTTWTSPRSPRRASRSRTPPATATSRWPTTRSR